MSSSLARGVNVPPGITDTSWGPGSSVMANHHLCTYFCRRQTAAWESHKPRRSYASGATVSCHTDVAKSRPVRKKRTVPSSDRLCGPPICAAPLNSPNEQAVTRCNVPMRFLPKDPLRARRRAGDMDLQSGFLAARRSSAEPHTYPGVFPDQRHVVTAPLPIAHCPLPTARCLWSRRSGPGIGVGLPLSFHMLSVKKTKIGLVLQLVNRGRLLLPRDDLLYSKYLKAGIFRRGMEIVVCTYILFLDAPPPSYL
ncbi:hypothetical protein F5144DRAFT_387085 [Chaetomium tenue]|uniref:Uncharacterized protein n=1 Tax=Chaetomium tenue TaxID=1854479 RepID=A0ACB7NUY6_9PEZI|nr:hypothetical protein F5144DRAFT_387085 [Chaetomium globosum]